MRQTSSTRATIMMLLLAMVVMVMASSPHDPHDSSALSSMVSRRRAHMLSWPFPIPWWIYQHPQAVDRLVGVDSMLKKNRRDGELLVGDRPISDARSIQSTV